MGWLFKNKKNFDCGSCGHKWSQEIDESSTKDIFGRSISSGSGQPLVCPECGYTRSFKEIRKAEWQKKKKELRKERKRFR